MAKVGYYRIKVATGDQKRTFSLIKNGEVVASKDVIPFETCDNGIILKYIDNNGQYRFLSLNSRYETQDNPELIGKADKSVLSLLDSGGATRDIGFKNNPVVSASVVVTSENLAKITSMYSSPRVLMYVGSGADTPADWVFVSLDISNPITKIRKGISLKLDVQIELQEKFSIKMI